MSDIRAEFEAAVRATWSDCYPFTRDKDGEYRENKLDGMWWGWQASRQALKGDPSKSAQEAWKYLQSLMGPDDPARSISADVLECPYPCGWRDLQSIAIKKAAFIARSAEDDIGTPFEDIRQAGAELGRIAIKLCSVAIKQEQVQ